MTPAAPILASTEAGLRGDYSGEAVYTTWRYGPTLPATWPLHLQRLQRDAARLGLTAPDDATIRAWLPQSTLDRQLVYRVRLDLVADGGNPRTSLPARTIARLSIEQVADTLGDMPPMTLRTMPPSRLPTDPLAGVKLAAMAGNYALRRQAQALGADDALLTAPNNLWSELPTAALVVGLRDGTLRQPGPAVGAVWSTTAAWLASQRPVLQGPLSTADLPVIQWAVALNAVWGARPIAAIDGQALGPPPDELIAAVRRAVSPVC